MVHIIWNRIEQEWSRLMKLADERRRTDVEILDAAVEFGAEKFLFFWNDRSAQATRWFVFAPDSQREPL